MIDFIEYVVAELKTKRLSKTNAVSLVRQFSRRASGSAAAAIHPLLQRNTSDLSEQRYSSTFSGKEFFLADHQVKADGQAGQKVLPGVAYLEMARAAVEEALPARPESTVLELHNIVWAQPVVVAGEKQVNIALLASGEEQIDFEVYSHEGGQELVHCQGRAVFSREPAPARLDLEQLETEMGQGRLEPGSVYATCTRMGLLYGPSFQGITAIDRGSGQLLARLRLPSVVADGLSDYVLHPSLMDGALQAAVGLIESETESTQALLPFALEALRILAPCTPEMVVWLRLAPGSQASDKVVKLDIDLCDDRGNVCVQMRGFSWRVLVRSGEIGLTAAQRRAVGTVFAAPVWQAGSIAPAGTNKIELAEHHVVFCELPSVDVPRGQIVFLQAERQKNIAERYSEYALECFGRIQAILQNKPQGKVLFQIVVADEREQAMLAGLSALLRTAALENPHFIGQLLLVPPDMTAEELAAHIEQEKSGALDPLVRYERGARQVLRWQEVVVETGAAPIAFKERGVYLITGGTGGLGLLFAKEILERTRDARVVLTGRSALSAEKQSLVDGLSAQAGRVSYRQVNLGDVDEVTQLIAAIQAEYGRLDGILHCAGMTADNFIIKKSRGEFSDVLAPKVTGTFHLDQASQDVELDFFVLFSAIGGALGNLGQADYAAANAFMDQFAVYRNRQVAAKQRHGRTRSINWPLWQAGGMGVDAAYQEQLQRDTGMQPMQSAVGIGALYRGLALPYDQLLVAEGRLVQLRRTILDVPLESAAPPAEQAIVPAAGLDSDSLAEKTQQYLRKQFSEVLKVPSQKIDPRAALENYGIDSIVAMQLTNQLETTFGSLPKTLFFEYQTIRDLADYFVANYSAPLTALLTPTAARESAPSEAIVVAPAAKVVSSRRASRRRSVTSGAPADDEPIAIIGLSGRYPEAIDVDAYWNNLRDGKDCITEVPKDRWDWREYFSEDRTKSGHHYSKWGGFIAGVDEFDPLFFNISPVDAEAIDPQERLFLQHAWMAMEDAGYTRASLQIPHERDLPGQVGVYVGVMYTEYQLFGSDALARGKRQGVPGSAASIANRVSYVLNLHGPSMTLDTMCSSSLSAIHLACQDLKHGRTSLAIAGGVNVSIHPNKYLVLSEGQFISSDGHCQSFGEGGDGYIPGEGVGVVVLKRLSEAKRDGDHIYGVIRGSALNHGGKTNGYSVPNPQAQAGVISRALAEANVDARHISYIEAHGTGTKLGDPIEIAALNRAFQQSTQETEFCLIGSAKSNIGHCESAAGIAGLTKILLQMQHQEIVPSLHSAQLNPNIDFAKSPFIVNQKLRPWDPPVVDGRTLPRIAGISSFGAGGSNAHMIIEEYQAPVVRPMVSANVVILLSARTAAQLQQKAWDLLEFVRPRQQTLDLVAMAYTLQVGREAMSERLGFVVSSVEQLVARLEAYVAGEKEIEHAYQGRVKRDNEMLTLLSTDADLQQAIGKWLANQKLFKLLELWVEGVELDWRQLYGEEKPRRISLPTYPFARERYWIDLAAVGQIETSSSVTVGAALHPLLHSNVSDLSEQRYRSTFTGDEFFLADHQVALKGQAGQKVFPGVAYLEMARAAIEQAMPGRAEATVLALHNTVWALPIVVAEKKEVNIALFANDDDRVDYEIYSLDADEEIVHCQGRAVVNSQPAPARVDLDELKAQLEGQLTPDTVYATLARMGLVYGPAFQGITAVHRGGGQVLAQLRLPAVVAEKAGDYVLHPSLMDGSLQAAVALMDGESSQPRLPFALETLRIVSPCTADMFAWVRFAPGSQASDSVVKLDIDLCDANGNVCVQMRGFSTRLLSNELGTARAAAIGSLIATPVWQTSVSGAASQVEYVERHVVLCELAKIEKDAVESLLPASRCVLLQGDPQQTIARRFSDYAVACFERIQAIFRSKLQGKALVQVVVPDDQEQAMLAGLSGLLNTAALESPQFHGQLILVPAQTSTEELAAWLLAEQTSDALVRYEHGARHVLRWHEVSVDADKPPIAFKEQGVYLITGGMGGLGIVFTKEILEQAREARVILTGRSPFSEERQARLDALSAEAGRLSYRQVDVADLEQVTRLISEVRSEYGRLDGILHSAGIVSDAFIVKKDSAHFSEVLGPKVTGTYNLDQASKDVDLDFFVLFSSVAGAAGNLGQADYAAANAFLDQFAAYRNRQVAAKQRRGRTLSIDWPLWHAGGMTVDAAMQELMQQTTGMEPMRTATGIEAFHRSLALPYDQTLVVAGDLALLRRTMLAGPDLPVETETVAAVAIDSAILPERTEEYLRKQLAGVLKIPSHQIDPQAAMEEYGIDSVLSMKLTSQLEKTFGSLPKTLFFEYQTIGALAQYFVAQYEPQLKALLAPAATPDAAGMPGAVQAPVPAPAKLASSRRSSRPRTASSPTVDEDPIAIIGLSGRYPEAVDLEAYWNNLRDGKDCITEVPRERWDWREYFSEDRSEPGRHYSKWGGFISGVDEFDPLFFNISPVDAEIIDPQERLFLQHVWMAMEDAGYTRAGMQVPSAHDLPGQVGVYVGVMYSEYQMFGAEAGARGKRLPIPGSPASIANRVSYVLNLHGPSVTLDTMCSSSLTAIHFACQDLKLGRTSMAIAGGVNVSIHPNKYLVLSAGQFISSDGHCQSFGEGGDGYIPGEGVGVVVLKRLSAARRDGDHIYGIIRGSALNHGGKTNGYTVPNPQAQANAIRLALSESHTDARHVSYIEAHGTGTTLGDPIEIAALSKAFHHDTQDTAFCLIGSAKSNIGHCESAAGIAGLTKVLLQMQHQQIVPSLHSARLNPHIDFASSPFVVNQELRPWEPPVIDGRTLPRIAGISSFGAGGSNAHILVEEYQAPVRLPIAVERVVILLSARTPEQLKQKAADLLDFIRPRLNSIDLIAMAYTLQVGREAMEERLGFVVSSPEELAEKLRAYVAGEQVIEDAYRGQVKRTNEALSVFSTDADLQQTVDKWIAHNKLAKLLDLWVKGLELDWSKLYGENRPQRISLPTYPFAKERYWIDTAAGGHVAAKGTAAAALHPLLHVNTSDLSEQRYRSTFTGDEFFLADHQVKADGRTSQKVLPGVAYLEMARAAIEQALPVRPESAVLELHNTVWARPIVVGESTQVNIALLPNDDGQIDYEIYSEDGDEEIVHCQGRAVLRNERPPAKIDLKQLESQMEQGQLEPESVYAACARMGLLYGPSFQGITAVHRGSGQLLAQLRLPAAAVDGASDYVLHPSLMDGALQACVGLIDDSSDRPSQPRVPFALETLRIAAPCTAEMAAWVRYSPGSHAADSVVKLDIDLCDDHGNVCVQMHGLSSRVLSHEVSVTAAQSRATSSLLAVPVWQTSGGETSADDTTPEFAEHHVILCDLPKVDVATLESVVPQGRCLSLQAGPEETIAQFYSRCAVTSFERIQGMFQGRPLGRLLVQIIVADEQEQALLAGLSGLLKTAAQENPRFAGQVILIPADMTADELGRHLEEEKSGGLDSLVKYEQGVRNVLRWQEVAADPRTAPVAFKDQGVYLITGGLGGLGLLFAKEILEQTRDARVVLTGRSAFSSEKQDLLDALSTSAGRLSYRQVDLSDLDQVTGLISAVRDDHGQLNGILHSAGMVSDRFILKKNSAEFRDVLTPKVAGTFNLDQASRDVELDFFVLFSSVAGAMGNLGQADYAAANGFMDQFAAYRNRQAEAGLRHGRTRSINWPLWQAGGMGVDEAGLELMRRTTGMQPMQTATGMDAFHRSLELPHDQILVAEGDLPQLRRALLAGAPLQSAPRVQQPVAVVEIAPESFAEKTQDYLRKEFAELLKLPVHKIDPNAALENYGIDSILAMRLTNQLEKTFGSLSKTLFFEYQTIAALAGYLMRAYPAVLREKLGLHEGARAKIADQTAVARPRPTSARRSKTRFVASQSNDQAAIAIVGLAGRYPQAENLQEFWRNLQNGRDSITEIPLERWDHTLYYDPDPTKAGKSYSKWGGFIADVDKFDPLFFNISPKEAELIDPQERLFLETVWETIEDAGYTKESISGGRVGVYVGVMWGQYELFGAESVSRGNASLTGSSYASVANRVSYFFDFHGPSMALDTMCSSSLTAIHLACDSIRKGEVDAAIAGGVNVTVHPYKYLGLSQGRFAASDGRCRSFGAGGDGYVPGEGVGAVLLKPLQDALRDGDQIYAVIKASTLNHGGKTNGYTVPNPNAQGDLIRETLRKANIDPKTLGYIETHGTGTSLGDPIEITGLLKAFEGATDDKQFCAIGSVKSNIGHLESAAGIAAVTKALLQIRHKQLVPSLHSEPPNPNIDFAASPFYVQTELTEWKRPTTHPRRVAVSSFGAGGSNAHLILEEFADARGEDGLSTATSPQVFVLSAKTPDALRRYAERIVNFLENVSGISLASVAYTSQVGRTPMDARLAVLTSSVEELREKLRGWIARGSEIGGSELEGVFYGNIKEAPYSAVHLIGGATGKAFLETLLAQRDLEKVARLWALGAEVDWSVMYQQGNPRKISLPTYPFAKERCWIPQETTSLRRAQESAPEIRKVAAHVPAEEKRRTYYYPQWALKALPAGEERRPAIGPILILDTSDELSLAMREQLGNDSIVLVRPGTSFEQIAPNSYVIDPEREEQFRALVENLESRELHPSVVLHHGSESCNLEERDEVARELNHGVYTLFHLCKALLRGNHRVPLRLMSVFSNPAETTAPLAAAMGGFFRTLTQEDPTCQTKVVEIQDGELSNAEKAALVWNELYDSTWTAEEIRYRRDEQRHVRSVRGLVEQAGPERNASALPLRKNGVYLITGGLGGLGIIFAEYLAKNYQARLILIGRTAPNARQEQALSRLKGYGAEVLALRADVAKLDDLEMVVREAKARFTQIHGVIHAAGVTRDAFILRKTSAEMAAVLAPKIYGTINVDRATQGELLDFFVGFASIAGVAGNAGQSDYAFGNRFLDAFAESREALRKARQRSGRTLSIDWPLWEEGGMEIPPDQVALLEKQTGLCPMPTQDGIRYWEDFLRSDAAQGVALYGIPSKIASFVVPQPVRARRDAAAGTEGVDHAALFAKTEAYLKALVGEEIQLSPDRIGSSDPLESFGIDSVMINRVNAQMERDLGALPKTLFYEHETVRELATYLVRESREALIALLGLGGSAGEPPFPVARIEEDEIRYEVVQTKERNEIEGIAIVGIHAYYPHSANLDEYWNNLKEGKDLIDLVPPNRWDYQEFYHPNPEAAAEGKIYCKWGGFLEDYDKFDPQFFKISTAEAKVLDPQERLFLESVWAAIEDAGYTRDGLRARHPKAGSADVGVFVGVTTNSYDIWAPEEHARGNFVNPTAMPWSIANRISYFFDFNGPSLPVDTACSSSLVAIHLACQSLRNRECQVAIAGGVNLYLHPAKYQSLCQKRMVSLDGKCHSYGAGDDGFVPGEGVGTLILKPLSEAIEDRDRIYAVIRSSAYDHAGRSNGYSAPNPNAQANLISQALKKAHIHPDTIGYVEGHGTGTQLGDSIEIAALTKAFETETERKQFCPIGSVKANIGHSESAAGIAGLVKVILQMQHGQLAPSIHSDEPNPNIEFRESPFYLQHGLSAWPTPSAHPRRALVNSFGAGGVNACVVVEDYDPPRVSDLEQEGGPYLFILSAKNEDRLREYADRMLAYLRGAERIDLASLCYTLQVGREAMEERLAIVVSDVAQLIDRLGDWSRRGSAVTVHRGSLGLRRGSKRSLKLVKTGMGEQSLIELASKWVAGEEVDWESVYSRTKPHRVSAPTYPFARERYWMSDSVVPERLTPASANLHPLIAYNASTLKEVRFSSSLPDTAFYAVDHQVLDERIFPGAGYLEMACIAANMASEQRVRKLTDIVWMRPLSFRTGAQVLRTVLRQEGESVEYVISSLDDENETIVHSEGRLAFTNGWTNPAEGEERMLPQTLKAQCAGAEDGAAFYERFSALGLHYGPSFQTIEELYVNDAFALAKLKIADHLKGDFGQFILHPSMIDGALQTIAGLAGRVAPQAAHLPFALDEIEIIKPVPETCYAFAQYSETRSQNHGGVTKFDIRLLNENGEVLVKLKNLYVRPFARPQTSVPSLAAPSAAKRRLLSLSGGPAE